MEYVKDMLPKTIQTTVAPALPPVAELAEDLRRMRTEEEARIERGRQEELARLRELARFD